MKLKDWAIVLSLLILVTGGLFAQSTLGVLKGVVTDESGAVIPGAKITITAGNYTRTITSGADGSYTLAGIPTGTYSVQKLSPAWRLTRTRQLSSMPAA